MNYRRSKAKGQSSREEPESKGQGLPLEADEAVSAKDFKFTITRCVKEAKESKFFLRMIAASEPQLADEARSLYCEAHELLCIFGSMRHKRQ